jgi:hypothetical protein
MPPVSRGGGGGDSTQHLPLRHIYPIHNSGRRPGLHGKRGNALLRDLAGGISLAVGQQIYRSGLTNSRDFVPSHLIYYSRKVENISRKFHFWGFFFILFTGSMSHIHGQ